MNIMENHNGMKKKDSRNDMGKIKKLSINASLLAGSILFALIILEVSLRFMIHKERFIGGDLPKDYIILDNVIGHDISKNCPVSVFKFKDSGHDIWSNELGCFDKPYKGEKDYIFLAGDSFVWGFTPFESKWGTVLEEQTGTRVLKCSSLGYGITHEYLKMKKTIDMVHNTPSLIVVAYFVGNDLLDDHLFGTPPVPKKKVLNIKIWLTDNSIVYNILKQSESLRSIGRKIGVVEETLILPNQYPLSENSVPWLKEAWKKQTKAIQDIKSYSDKIGTKLFVVIIPTREQVYEFLRPQVKNVDWTFLNKKVGSFLEKEKIGYLDLLPLLEQYANKSPRKSLDAKNDLYWKYDGHWNIKGNRLAGLIVSKNILENNLIKVKDREEKLQKIESLLSNFKNEGSSND